jgi:gamma-glutamylcyclotransferase (GGCT)/AIG2-like uncharacterized protein YtfP
MQEQKNIAGGPSSSTSPPYVPPPPPPPPLPSSNTPSIGPSNPRPLKVKAWKEIWRPSPRSTTNAPKGTYLFYGSLQEPVNLQKILDFASLPTLRPAQVSGYKLKLWGTYPAAVEDAESSITGLAFEVKTEEDAEKLARYETNSYDIASCTIRVQEADSSSRLQDGYLFVYCGNPGDLQEGDFDLDTWRRLVGRPETR